MREDQRLKTLEWLYEQAMMRNGDGLLKQNTCCNYVSKNNNKNTKKWIDEKARIAYS